MTRPIVIGAGHNGLVAAFYLARAGLRPLVLERREVAGGTAATHEVHPGFRVPTLAHAIGPLRPEIERDMDLARRGVEIIHPSVTCLAPTEDARAVVLARDAQVSSRWMAPLSAHDASRLPAFDAAIGRVARAVSSLQQQPPPTADGGAATIWRLLQMARPIRALPREDAYRFVRWLPMPVADLVDEWFEHATLRAAIATRGLWGARLGPRSGGTAAALLIEAARQPASPSAPCFVRGGPGALVTAMAAAALEAGAEIRTAAEVARIETTEDGVKQVVLASGEVLDATLVVSNADPVRTLLGFIDPQRLAPETVARLQHYRTAGATAKINLALDRLPAFTATASLPDGLTPERALAGRILIAPTIDYLERAFDESKYGRSSPEPWLECTLPTLSDPDLAPPGRHVMSVYARYAPYELIRADRTSPAETPAGGASGAAASAKGQVFLEAVLRTLEQHAPGLTSAIVATELWTPPDLEARFGLTGGHSEHGEMALDQLYLMRPLPGWFGGRTPVRGVYLCGAGIHPGGGLTGANGALAARTVLADLNGLEPPCGPKRE